MSDRDLFENDAKFANEAEHEHAEQPAMSDEERAALEHQMGEVKGEIARLRQLLRDKERELAAVEKALGITAFSKIAQSVNNVKQSNAYQKTSTALQSFGEKTSTAFKNVGQKTGEALRNLTKKDEAGESAVDNTPKEPPVPIADRFRRFTQSVRDKMKGSDGAGTPPATIASSHSNADEEEFGNN
eukprot:m.36944 g.36944  ORF g.36944 m.36944 type:complete len:186 (-) comp11480_c0_seq1:1628-2185(-)